MAGKDRTSYKSQVNTDLPSASTITAAEVRTHLQDELADNIRFRLDDADTQNKTSGVFSIDFDGVDQIITTITGISGSTVTISNLEDGDVKYWVVNKSATETISFAAATDISPVQDYITAATKVIYRITYKNTTMLVEPLLQNVQQATESILGIAEIATTAESQAGTNDTKFITPAKLQDVTATYTRAGVIELATAAETQAGSDATRAVTPGTLQDNQAWTTATLAGGFSGTVKYRKNNIGNVEVTGNFTPNAENGTIFTLPVGYRPSETQYMTVYGKQDTDGFIGYRITISTSGAVGTSIGTPYTNGASNYIHGTVYLTN